MSDEIEDRHECQCDNHDCKGEVKCPVDETPSGHLQHSCADWAFTHICEECESDPDCNGEALNPPPYEGGLY